MFQEIFATLKGFRALRLINAGALDKHGTGSVRDWAQDAIDSPRTSASAFV
jgi:hypothetical protein